MKVTMTIKERKKEGREGRKGKGRNRREVGTNYLTYC